MNFHLKNEELCIKNEEFALKGFAGLYGPGVWRWKLTLLANEMISRKYDQRNHNVTMKADAHLLQTTRRLEQVTLLPQPATEHMQRVTVPLFARSEIRSGHMPGKTS